MFVLVLSRLGSRSSVPSQRSASLLETFMSSSVTSTFDEFTPNDAARLGHVAIVRSLRAQGLHVDDPYILDEVAGRGYMDVIRDIYEHEDGVRPTCGGADDVAVQGNLEMVTELAMRFNMWPTCLGSNCAAGAGRLDVVRFLCEHGKGPNGHGADWAAGRGHLHVVHFLRSIGVHCCMRGAGKAAIEGHMHVVRDLFEHGIQCHKWDLLYLEQHARHEEAAAIRAMYAAAGSDEA